MSLCGATIVTELKQEKELMNVIFAIDWLVERSYEVEVAS